MTPSNKNANDDAHVDRISDLPRNVIDDILSKLPTKELVRTSILSRKWRYMWSSVPRLKFDLDFFRDYKYPYDPKVSDIINEVLLLHNGSVRKCTFIIPTGYIMRTGCLSKWILVLSRRGLKYLELVNHHWDLYQIPSHTFSCQDLTHLELYKFELSLPPNFLGFKSLIYLYLYEVKVESNALENLIFACPCLEELALSGCSGLSLEELDLFGCSGLECINLSSPSLKVFYINGGTFSICLKNAKNIIDLTLLADIHRENSDSCGISDLFKDLKLEKLCLGGIIMKILSTCSIPETLKRSINSLKHLELTTVSFSESKEILMIICLLESCHNLVELTIKGFSIADGCSRKKNKSIADEPLTGNIKECSSLCLSQLKNVDVSVEIKTPYNYKHPLTLIRFVLANAPSLETLTFQVEFDLQQSDKRKSNLLLSITQDLLKMERASQRAKVKFLHGDLYGDFTKMQV